MMLPLSIGHGQIWIHTVDQNGHIIKTNYDAYIWYEFFYHSKLNEFQHGDIPMDVIGEVCQIIFDIEVLNYVKQSSSFVVNLCE